MTHGGDRAQTPIGTNWLESGVLVHEVTSFDVITPDQARTVVDSVKQLRRCRPVIAVVDIRSVGYALPEARHAFAGTPDESGKEATALVVANAASRALARVFLGLSPPQRPIEVFTSRERAMEWAVDQHRTGGTETELP